MPWCAVGFYEQATRVGSDEAGQRAQREKRQRRHVGASRVAQADFIAAEAERKPEKTRSASRSWVSLSAIGRSMTPPFKQIPSPLHDSNVRPLLASMNLVRSGVNTIWCWQLRASHACHTCRPLDGDFVNLGLKAERGRCTRVIIVLARRMLQFAD